MSWINAVRSSSKDFGAAVDALASGPSAELRSLLHLCFEGGVDVGADGGTLALAIFIEIEAIDATVQLRLATIDPLIAAVVFLVGDTRDVEGKPSLNID